MLPIPVPTAVVRDDDGMHAHLREEDLILVHPFECLFKTPHALGKRSTDQEATLIRQSCFLRDEERVKQRRRLDQNVDGNAERMDKVPVQILRLSSPAVPPLREAVE